ncbi:MAG: NAD(P)/FAD-dependent oxidoreductase [Candidatus Glassbacteria bacterium]
MQARPRIVIAGAGFGGLWAAKALDGEPVEVVVVDRNNYHTFLPLLYQVAAAEIEPEAIAHAIRSTLNKSPNIHFLMAEITGVDLANRLLVCRDRDIFYDYLVLATGSATHFFGVPGAADHAFELKTLEQGIALRNQILARFEKAAVEPDSLRRRAGLSFCIVGGGPTGVEFAGALSELVGGIVPRDYPVLADERVRVVLLEAAGTLLPGMPARLAGYAHRRLEKMGVEVLTGARVSRITPVLLECANGRAVETETVVWTAGVRGSGFPQHSGLPEAPGGRIPVDDYLQVFGYPQVYAIGDIAWREEGGAPLLMMAPVATSQGEAAARNILRRIANRPQRAYHYRDLGNMVTIGRNKAVANLFGRSFCGGFAWLIWLVVHLFNLIGFRNRLLVLLGWAWDYFFFERTVKLILPSAGGPGGRAEARVQAGRWVHCRQPGPHGRLWPHHVRPAAPPAPRGPA